MEKKCGRTCYAIGVAGNVILVGMWVIARASDNPITGRAGPIAAFRWDDGNGIGIVNLSVREIVPPA
ncbi:MAG: hypothetical protein WA941_00470 [Nitrososphaeraceae archaeon]